MSDQLVPLEDKTIEEWRKCAVLHERCAFDISEKLRVVESENKEMREILQDFLTTKECRETWIEEMHATIDAVLNETEGK